MNTQPTREISAVSTLRRCPRSMGISPSILILLFTVLGGATSHAQSYLTLAMNHIFSPPSGGIPPSGTTPWLLATFQNNGTGLNGEGSVRLTMTASNLGSAHVKEWDFNFNPTLNPSSLNFTLVGAAPAVITNFVKATDNKQADGDGLYDIYFGFSSSGADRFTNNEVFTYDITGYSSLTAGDFNFLSTPAGGHGPFYTAAHIGGIPDPNGGTASVWVTDNLPSDNLVPIPEPSSFAAIAGVLVCGAITIRRRLSQKH